MFDGRLKRWASERADYRNVNFRERDSSGRAIDAPWLPEDFLGTGNRVARSLESSMSQMEVARANSDLNRIVKGAPPPEDLPAWAR